MKTVLVSVVLTVLMAAAFSVDQRPPHHLDEGFRNLYVENQEKSIFSYLKVRWFGDEPFTEYRGREHLVPTVETEPARLADPGPAPRVTWLGHATVLIQYRGINVITDPIFSERASPVGFAGPRRYTALPLDPAALPPIHFAVISHSHYDHLDQATVERLGSRTTWLVPLGLKSWFVDRDISPESVVELDWWQSHDGDGLTLTATPSQHWSARGLFDRFETLWASWVIDFGDYTVWFGGDTGYTARLFMDIAERFQPFDLALIPIGGYFPRDFMRQNHVNPEEAVAIHLDLQARRSLGIHWGTFYLTGEPIEEPPSRLAAELERRGLSASAFEAWPVGESRALPRERAAFQAR